MKPEELGLLLTVARVLRAEIWRVGGPYAKDNFDALNEALKPFDPDNVAPLKNDFCSEDKQVDGDASQPSED